MEVAAADDPAAACRERIDRGHPAAGEHERVVGRGVELDVQDAAEVVEGVLDGAVDLGHAAQGVRILDLVDRGVMAALELAVAQEMAELPRDGDLARMRPGELIGRGEGHVRPEQRLDAHRGRDATRSAPAGPRRRAGAPRWRPSAACR